MYCIDTNQNGWACYEKELLNFVCPFIPWQLWNAWKECKLLHKFRAWFVGELRTSGCYTSARPVEQAVGSVFIFQDRVQSQQHGRDTWT